MDRHKESMPACRLRKRHASRCVGGGSCGDALTWDGVIGRKHRMRRAEVGGTRHEDSRQQTRTRTRTRTSVADPHGRRDRWRAVVEVRHWVRLKVQASPVAHASPLRHVLLPEQPPPSSPARAKLGSAWCEVMGEQERVLYHCERAGHVACHECAKSCRPCACES